MKLKKITIKDRKYFDYFLKLSPHELSVYAFENIYIWRSLFEIYWAEIKNNLCIFFEDCVGCFLYLPPLSKRFSPKVIDEVFKIMNERNCNKAVSRIENVEGKDLDLYQNLRYDVIYKSCDYVCKRTSLAELKGNKFKSKRSDFNYFVKNYQYNYMLFSLKHINACLDLYELWMEQRKNKGGEETYRNMLEDNRRTLRILLNKYEHLDCIGRIVKIGNKIRAFTFGFELNQGTFCILYEITDLSINGLPQFIFRTFCRELKHKYINIMDDSGLENLKIVKLSYHPEKIIPAYIVKEK